MSKIRVRKRRRLIGVGHAKSLTYQLDVGTVDNSVFIVLHSDVEFPFTLSLGSPHKNLPRENMQMSREELTKFRDMLTRVLKETETSNE